MVYSFSKRQRKGGSIRRPIRSQKSKGTVAADVVGVTLPDAETQARCSDRDRPSTKSRNSRKPRSLQPKPPGIDAD